MEEYYSAAQAATIIGMDYGTLHHHLKVGNLQARKFGPQYAIHKDDLEQFRKDYAAGIFSRGPKMSEAERLEKITRDISNLEARRAQLLGAK